MLFKFFKKTKKEPQDFKEILEYLKRLEENYQNLSRELKSLREEMKTAVQKIGVVRFNPFKEMGGDLSFSIALLDAENNGFVITSLYERERNRVYAKPIKHGTSDYQLSEEEKMAIEKATQTKNA